jgi:hypothetical protein
MTLFNNNKTTINDIGKIIDNLPEELHVLKKQFRDDTKKKL